MKRDRSIRCIPSHGPYPMSPQAKIAAKIKLLGLLTAVKGFQIYLKGSSLSLC